jgi:NADPH:quinone reductase-like Zn-dependent oxidoreductase
MKIWDYINYLIAMTPGDSLDGYAREKVVRPANWFTRAPKNYSHAEAATLITAGLTAWRALEVMVL